MADEAVRVSREGGAAVIELNRPDAAERLEPGRSARSCSTRSAAWPRTTPCAPSASPAPGARSPPAPTCATSAARARRPTGSPTCTRTLDERYHPIIDGDPHDAQARRRGGQRPGGRHRLLARAGLRPRRRGRVGLLPAGLREHRPRARRRLVAVRAQRASGFARAARDGDARRARQAPSRRRAGGSINRVVPDDELRGRGRRARRPPGGRADAVLRRLQAPAQRLAATRARTTSSSSRRASSRRWRTPTTSCEGVARVPREARPPSAADEPARTWPRDPPSRE